MVATYKAKGPGTFTAPVVRAARNLLKHHSFADVSDMLGVSIGGLHKAVNRKPRTRTRKETRGRKPAVTPADMTRIAKLRECTKRSGGNPTAAYTRRKLHLKTAADRRKRPSLRTVQRCIGKAGNKGKPKDRYLKRPRKGSLTEAKMRLRVDWCRARQHRTRAWWRRVHAWVDCTQVEMPVAEKPSRSDKQWRKPHERHNAWAQKSPSVYMAPKGKLFGAISPTPAGSGKLLCLTTYTLFNAESACRIFKRHVIPALRRTFGHLQEYLVMVDGDGAFRSDEFKAFAAKNQIRLFPWVASSPDLAPIENLWNERKEVLQDVTFESRKWRDGVKRNNANTDAWAQLMLSVYRKARPAYISSLIDCMPSRMRKCIERKGARIGR